MLIKSSFDTKSTTLRSYAITARSSAMLELDAQLGIRPMAAASVSATQGIRCPIEATMLQTSTAAQGARPGTGSTLSSARSGRAPGPRIRETPVPPGGNLLPRRDGVV